MKPLIGKDIAVSDPKEVIMTIISGKISSNKTIKPITDENLIFDFKIIPPI
ncbi:hypothetical protein FC88_GL002337 [Companilactobacillus futsaii JCM 17355]|uniref:Uncharacterized protein n=1 Tax=Companilactobacillus futsaii JCM 17355 TaxID=1423818 RepID=A0ABR5P7H5_9LACO|nr:hypothetical protein FC88_GL002337 [Companilactobacillus futsaii JCM 17355]